jgi:hypothetical protein
MGVQYTGMDFGRFGLAPAVRAGQLPGARCLVRAGHADQAGYPDPGHGRHRRLAARAGCLDRRRRLAPKRETQDRSRLSICHRGKPSSAVFRARRKHFLRHILKREGSLDAAQGSAAAVSAMIELIAMTVGVVSALIFLTHVIDAYRA